VRFAGFISFFPHLVAGPLTRHHQLIPQLTRIARTGISPRWREGVLLFSVGLCKKVLIADRLGNLIDPLLAPPLALDASQAWLGLLGYAFQIYFDFSGYSDMAIGLGRLFGIELPQNFNSPYKAASPSDFWRRWHMTWSLWLRDYLYIPLGGNRCSPARRRFNLRATMVLGGL
jgi:D-alanyl-lipoteichoic acid acyltransferase DltB (MBOAT superfamily)